MNTSITYEQMTVLFPQYLRLFAAAEERLDATTEMDTVERADYARSVAEQVDASEPVSPRALHALHAGEAVSRTTYPDQLTAREVEVLRLAAEGLSNPQVAERLVISPRTVQGHMRSIFNKINESGLDDNLWSRRGRAVLVRPDGHVAWRCRTGEHDPIATLDRVLKAVLGDRSP